MKVFSWKQALSERETIFTFQSGIFRTQRHKKLASPDGGQGGLEEWQDKGQLQGVLGLADRMPEAPPGADNSI